MKRAKRTKWDGMRTDGKECVLPHFIGECACYEFDDERMCVHPCIFIGESVFAASLFCAKKSCFYNDGKLPKKCKYRQTERNASYESEEG